LRRYGPLSLLPGAHQVANAAVAIRLLEEARAVGVRVDLAAVARAFSGTRWPGRLQWLPGDPPLLLDGAHNPAGARALADYLKALGPFVLVFGAMADKGIAAIAGTLFPLAREVVLTQLPMKRAATPRAIARVAPRNSPRLHRTPTPAAALRLARRLSAGAPVVVAGSLYLVGAILAVRRAAWS
jgi:dihydrofolate synthase/folylpolyglutamate synthase